MKAIWNQKTKYVFPSCKNIAKYKTPFTKKCLKIKTILNHKVILIAPVEVSQKKLVKKKKKMYKNTYIFATLRLVFNFPAFARRWPALTTTRWWRRVSAPPAWGWPPGWAATPGAVGARAPSARGGGASSTSVKTTSVSYIYIIYWFIY